MSAAMSRTKISVLLILYISLVLGDKYKPIEVEIKENPGGEAPKIFTPEELSKYDASDPDLPIYLAIKGVVFDVTSGKDFYNKKSEYNKLVAKDASRGHALWSLEEQDLNYDLSGLTDDQLEGLDQVYEGTYMAKYPVVGYMEYLVKEQGKTFAKRFSNDEL